MVESKERCSANALRTIGDNMRHVLRVAKQVAPHSTPVFLQGKLGTNADDIAQYIHNNSNRADKPFVKISCSEISEPLSDAKLFGCEKDKIGLFELANHGTILLDEIGDMSLALQTKLLRMVRENEIIRVGGTSRIPLDVRIISATSRNIDEMVAEGRFLDALYYRLKVVELNLDY